MKKEATIVKLIEMTWDSLHSHLDECHSPSKVPPSMKGVYGDRRFHKKCVKEYAEMIRMLTTLL